MSCPDPPRHPPLLPNTDGHKAAALGLLAGLSLLASAAIAQVVPPQNLPTYQRNVSGSDGADGAPGEYEQPGDPGNKGSPVPPLSVEFSPGVTVAGQAGQSSVSLLGNGGKGGAGGVGGEINPFGGFTNGGAGAGGTDGGNITFKQDGQSGVTSSILGTSSPVPVLLEGNGGDGGDGGLAGTYGRGGQGGNGGSGGTLDFTQAASASITSTTAGVTAVLLMSDGANAGDSQDARTWLEKSVPYGGGEGGNGGLISATLSGSIVSAGAGVQALSVGGNGGNGGNAESNGSLGSDGGNGGDGGGGGAITLTLAGGSIVATGDSAPAKGPAQPTQGGGTIAFSNTVAALQALIAGGIGGEGGTADGNFGKGIGGSGGGVVGSAQATLSNVGGSITTSGYAAAGMLAQNIGGHGGNGAYGGGVFVAKGGTGNKGGTPGGVMVTGSHGSITTTGDSSSAMVAQSIGGGGGYGGDARVEGVILGVAVGGDGANGGDGQMAIIYNGTHNGDLTQFTNGLIISTTGYKSSGMVAQSIGGGGGIAGDAQALVPAGASVIAVGGNGGTGGNGSTINAFNGGVIQTLGNDAIGIDGQSIGGGGGSGGAANSLVAGVQFTAASAVGGNGGKGGNGGDVYAANQLQVITGGTDAYAIMGQSIGGGGGHAGTSVSRNLQFFNDPEVPSFDLNVSIGGTGGQGGTGGGVTITNSGAAMTTQAGSTAIFAQSIGGGGGDGGDSNALSLAFQSSNVNVNTVVGGNGGSGGNGGVVSVSNTGLVITLANDAIGVKAQSIGGGGGTGGYGETTSGSVRDNDKSLQVSVAVGGHGGAGGQGGSVTVDNTDGGMFTRGSNSFGIFAESIGGGGGDGSGALANGGGGGKVNINVSVGGSGGAGGSGGSVTVTNNGAILTRGGGASAVYAESIGGGGGVGGDAALGTGSSPTESLANFLVNGMGVGETVTSPDGKLYVLDQIGGQEWNVIDKIKTAAEAYDSLNPKDPDKEPATLSSLISVDVGGGFGGHGGSAGAGGTVAITNTGDIETDAAFAEGIFAQSVGGGGGNGGAAISTNSTSIINGSLGIGGRGGSSGNGGPVTIANTGSIATFGDLSFAIYGQSIGGGGGKGGASLGDPAVLTDVTVNLGGDGGANGTGGNVTVGSSGGISTGGSEAAGVVAQSVGGGGGISGIMIISADNEGGQAVSHSGVNVAFVPESFGGAGGASGNGGSATVNLTGGALTTSGTDAYGVLAQSIGGGGGLVVGVTGQNGSGGPDSIFGSGKLSGNGGTVNVTLSGDALIKTTGNGAVGILAESIGGGGGIVGGMSNIRLEQGSYSANTSLHSGQGGNIEITVGPRTSITTSGVRAHGIFAQSAGGGGGLFSHQDGGGFAIAGSGGYSCGNSCTGIVSVNVMGGVAASGSEAYGIYAQSRGNGANGVNIAVGGTGYVDGNGTGGAAIFIDSPNGNNQIDNSGFIGGQSGIAIDGNAAATIDNRGSIIGNFQSSGGQYTITNESGARIDGSRLITGTLKNAGELVIGTTASQQTHITSNLASTGEIAVGVNFAAGKADTLQVDGSANISGSILLTPINLQAGTVKILDASSVQTGSITVSSATYGAPGGLLTAGNQYLYTYGYTSTATTLSVTATGNFTTVSQNLNSNQTEVAGQWQSLFDQGVKGAGNILMTLASEIHSESQYIEALESAGSESLGSMAIILREIDQSFAASMMSCPTYAGDDATLTEQSCGWVRATGGARHRDSTSESLGFNADTWTYQLGGQRELSDNWLVGGSLAYDTDDIAADHGRAKLDGSGGIAGAFVKYQRGPWLLSGAVSGGVDGYHSTRFVTVGTVQSTALGSPDLEHLGLHASAAYQVPFRTWYLKPLLELDTTYLHLDGFTEEGSPFALRVNGQHHTSFSAVPMLEIGSRLSLSGRTLVRPFVRLGADITPDNDWRVAARFAAAPDVADPFSSATSLPHVTARLGAGVDAFNLRGFELKLQYDGEFTRHYGGQQGTLRVAYRF